MAKSKSEFTWLFDECTVEQYQAAANHQTEPTDLDRE